MPVTAGQAEYAGPDATRTRPHTCGRRRRRYEDDRCRAQSVSSGVRPGSEDATTSYFNGWWRDRAPKVQGAVAGSIHRNGASPSEFILSVVLDNKGTYEANAADPEQDKWFQGPPALLARDPRWLDGDVCGCNHV